MKIKHYFLTAAATYFIFLIYLAPISPIVHALTKNNSNITIQQIEGSPWSGRAQSIKIQQHTINEVQWSFAPWQLFLGKVSYDLQALYKNQPLKTSISLSLTQTLFIDDLSINLPARTVGDIAGLPIGHLDGTIKVKINSASIAAETIPQIDGVITWEKAGVVVAERASLGEVNIVINENDTSPLAAIISNTPGDLDINGDITVTEDGSYTLDIKLQPTQNASKNLRDSLKFFATPQPNGSFIINNTGDLSSLGLM